MSDAEDLLFKALADPGRRKLLDRLHAHDGQTFGELCEHLDMPENAGGVMKYREIWHELHLRSTPHAAYDVLTDPKKLAGWWTTDTRGQSAVGKTLEFWFNGHLAAEMVVTELKPDALVRWRVTDRGIGDWTDTEISFEVFRRGDKTILHLRHSKWRETAEMFPECSMHWAIFLLSLKELVETGRGRPHPHDMPVNI